MKRHNYLIISLLAVVLVFSACKGGGETFSESQLIGKWKRSVTAPDGTPGYDCYRYDDGGNGVTWDTSEDVAEHEAQPFEWTLNGNKLLIVHIGEMGQRVPKTYTIKQLTTNMLSYEDGYGTKFTFSSFTGNP